MSANSGKCLNDSCWGGYPFDGNGHGTFTASEIVGAVQGIGMQGVAPAGSLLAVQVLNSNGSGSSTDIANGIYSATVHGAGAEPEPRASRGNGRGGLLPEPRQLHQLSWRRSGVYVVFAGGNSGLPFVGGATITGFSDTAIQHMLFMGSTDASKQLS